MAVADRVERADAVWFEEQAAALDARAEALREQARDLSREATSLRTEADRLRRPDLWGPVPIIRPGLRGRGADDAGFLAEVADALDDMGGASSTELAARLDTSQQRVRDALLKLESMGTVQRSGLNRGTRWFPANPAEAPDMTPAQRPRNLEGVVRDACRRLDVFTFDDLAGELSDVAEGTLRRWLRTLEVKGTLYAETVGTSKLYEYAKPTEAGPANPRRKEAPPEVVAAREAATLDRKRGAMNLSSGRRVRTGNKRSDEAIRKAQKAGATARIKRNQHVEVVTSDGQRVGLALTPSKGSARTDRDKLRKAGLDV